MRASRRSWRPVATAPCPACGNERVTRVFSTIATAPLPVGLKGGAARESDARRARAGGPEEGALRRRAQAQAGPGTAGRLIVSAAARAQRHRRLQPARPRAPARADDRRRRSCARRSPRSPGGPTSGTTASRSGCATSTRASPAPRSFRCELRDLGRLVLALTEFRVEGQRERPPARSELGLVCEIADGRIAAWSGFFNHAGGDRRRGLIRPPVAVSRASRASNRKAPAAVASAPATSSNVSPMPGLAAGALEAVAERARLPGHGQVEQQREAQRQRTEDDERHRRGAGPAQAGPQGHGRDPDGEQRAEERLALEAAQIAPIGQVGIGVLDHLARRVRDLHRRDRRELGRHEQDGRHQTGHRDPDGERGCAPKRPARTAERLLPSSVVSRAVLPLFAISPRHAAVSHVAVR